MLDAIQKAFKLANRNCSTQLRIRKIQFKVATVIIDLKKSLIIDNESKSIFKKEKDKKKSQCSVPTFPSDSIALFWVPWPSKVTH